MVTGIVLGPLAGEERGNGEQRRQYRRKYNTQSAEKRMDVLLYRNDSS